MTALGQTLAIIIISTLFVAMIILAVDEEEF